MGFPRTRRTPRVVIGFAHPDEVIAVFIQLLQQIFDEIHVWAVIPLYPFPEPGRSAGLVFSFFGTGKKPMDALPGFSSGRIERGTQLFSAFRC